MIAIFVLALLLFGPKKLPELARMLAKGLSEFRRAKNELKTTFETHMRELERETQAEQKSIPETTTYTPPKYSYPYEDYERYQAEAQQASSTATTTDTKAEEAAEVRVSAPVEGTVARTNGTPSLLASQSVTSLVTEEDHQA